MDTGSGFACWVKNGESVARRSVTLGDGNEMFIQVNEGLETGDEVVLDPLANIKEAQLEAAALIRKAESEASKFEDL